MLQLAWPPVTDGRRDRAVRRPAPAGAYRTWKRPSVYVCLANTCRAACRTAEAIPLHEQTLAARERVLGPDHPHTLASRNNLATAYRAAGRGD